MRVKICGLTRPQDAEAAQAAGADAIGLVFAPGSRRRITVEQALAVVAGLSPFVTRVGVFRNADLAEVRGAVARLRLDAVQLHGSESEAYAASLRPHVKVIRALAFRDHPHPDGYPGAEHDALMLDSSTPGSGEPFSWSAAGAWAGYPGLIVAGGLTPANVAEAVRTLSPFAVDVSSGVEVAPGVKSAELIDAFVRAAKGM